MIIKFFEHNIEDPTVYEYQGSTVRYDYTITQEASTLMVSQDLNLLNSLETASLALLGKTIQVQIFSEGQLLKAFVVQIIRYSMGNAQAGSTQIAEKIMFKILEQLD